MERQVLDIPWKTLWRLFFFALLVAILFLGRNIILALFLAIAISSGLEFIIAYFEKKIPRTLAVILVFLVCALFVAIVIYFIVPFLIGDLSILLSGLGNSSLKDFITPFTTGDANSLTSWANSITVKILSGDLSLGAFQGVFGGLTLGITILMVSFYLSLSRDGVERFLKSVVPEEEEESVMRIYARSMSKISFWVRTQVLLSFLIGVLVWAALFLLKVHHSLLVGILAAVFEIIPFVGPVVAGAIAVLFALLTSPSLAIYTLIVFILIQQFESNVLVPLLTRRTVGLHPVVVIVALLIGIEAAGLLGALVAIPAAAVFQEVVEDRGLRKLRN